MRRADARQRGDSMILRKIIKIDEERCTGCGACAAACHEGAIEMVDGKAKLTREDYCDGLGDCLPACPVDAISFEEREAPAYDEAAVLAAKKKAQNPLPDISGTRLANWPVQIKLAPVNAPCFDKAELLIAADCSAFAYGNFHNDFMKDRVTLIGCPKLDAVDYSEKLSRILAENDIKSITLVRMQVPCCGGLTMAVNRALMASGKRIPLNIVTISSCGELV